MKATGRTTSNMEKEQKHGLTAQNMMVIIKKEKNMDKENIVGQMDQVIMDYGLKIKYVEM